MPRCAWVVGITHSRVRVSGFCASSFDVACSLGRAGLEPVTNKARSYRFRLARTHHRRRPGRSKPRLSHTRRLISLSLVRRLRWLRAGCSGGNNPTSTTVPNSAGPKLPSVRQPETSGSHPTTKHFRCNVLRLAEESMSANALDGVHLGNTHDVTQRTQRVRDGMYSSHGSTRRALSGQRRHRAPVAIRFV